MLSCRVSCPYVMSCVLMTCPNCVVMSSCHVLPCQFLIFVMSCVAISVFCHAMSFADMSDFVISCLIYCVCLVLSFHVLLSYVMSNIMS